MIQLATPTFVSGPRDDLATADIYTQQSTQVINSIQKLVNSGDLDLSSVLRGGTAIADQLIGLLPVITGVKNGLLQVNKDNLVARLAASSSMVVSGLRNMDGPLVSKIGGNIPNLSASMPGGADVIAQVGSMSQVVGAARLTDMASIGRTIADVTGNTSLFSLQDPSSQIGVFTGLIQEASRYGLKNTYGALMSGVTDPVVLSQVAQRVIPVIIANSDTASLHAMAQSIPGGSAKLVYPQLIGEFGSTYTHPEASGVQARAQQWQDLSGAYTQIDPQWNTCTRAVLSADPAYAPPVIASVTAVQQGSEDFQDLVQQQALTAPAIQDKLQVLGTQFAPTDVDEQLALHFPYTLTGENQRQVSRVEDPRAVQDMVA